MSLARIQANFQSALLGGGTSVLDELAVPAQETKHVMFDVYRNAYLLRLADILADDFQRLHTYIGDDVFYALARGYIDSHPSRYPSARDFGRGFPEFTAEQQIAKAAPMIAAIVRLEGLLNDIFDCADAAALELLHLSAFAPEDFARLVFTPHPSARRLDGPSGLEATFTALGSGQPPPPAPGEPAKEYILVWRKDVLPHYRAQPYEEAMLWDEAAKGAPFAALCEMLATYDAPETAAVRAAGYVQGWIAQGQLARAVLSA